MCTFFNSPVQLSLSLYFSLLLVLAIRDTPDSSTHGKSSSLCARSECSQQSKLFSLFNSSGAERIRFNVGRNNLETEKMYTKDEKKRERDRWSRTWPLSGCRQKSETRACWYLLPPSTRPIVLSSRIQQNRSRRIDGFYCPIDNPPMCPSKLEAFL